MTYRTPDSELALEALDEPSRDLRDETNSPEPNKLDRMIHPELLAHPQRQPAPLRGHQRPHQNSQQTRQADQTHVAFHAALRGSLRAA